MSYHLFSMQMDMKTLLNHKWHLSHLFVCIFIRNRNVHFSLYNVLSYHQIIHTISDSISDGNFVTLYIILYIIFLYIIFIYFIFNKNIECTCRDDFG